MAPFTAGAVVFLTSGAVLILEILAARLLAPFVGVTLETYTAVIGTVLAGIASGTWLGGRLADRVDPRSMLGPLLVAGGAMSMATVPLVRAFGPGVAGESGVVVLSMLAFFAPAAVLSAVTPTVVKLQLLDLRRTGRVVGSLSALGTSGAIAGTFLAGFVLVEAAPTTTSILATGAGLTMAGGLVWVWLAAGGRRLLAATSAAALLVAGAGTAAGSPCEVETVYHCAIVVEDPNRPGGRLLVLDTLSHSYVDLQEPDHLEFRYTRVFADVVAAHAPEGPLAALHIGGGGFTMPRYLSAVRPGSTSRILEIDPGLVELSRRRLGLRTGDGTGLEVDVGDARLLVESVPPSTYDVALGDAFGGLAVPWHLTTVEFAGAVRSRLRPGGLYVMNLIDSPPARFARAELATLRSVFGHVALIAPPALLRGDRGGNFVIAASTDPLDLAAIGSRIAWRGGAEQVLGGAGADAFAGDAPLLTDDRAPVDQWLARARRTEQRGMGRPPTPRTGRPRHRLDAGRRVGKGPARLAQACETWADPDSAAPCTHTALEEIRSLS